ncbi:hypothetical protein ANCCAN_21000 [Ancylostoma caninum]|uniref:7TM GPCR serpentine receptor class x (Srx) domain-containing protein n=1 Tax=Ancylostoma caninum TaxID=29170 RepID=A0A368FNS7_ANCCA|nr:hypothetical protein ANCCAN_21000 [Ancylostoma caninum]
MLIVTSRSLIRISKKSPSLSTISLGYCTIILLIIIEDLGSNFLMLRYSTMPIESRARYPFHEEGKLFWFSIVITALKFYGRFVLILIHAVNSLNRFCAVFFPLQYASVFTHARIVSLMSAVFVVCLPVFFIYSFQIGECSYYFHPIDIGYYYNDMNTCYDIHQFVEWFLFATILSSSIFTDILISIFLFCRYKNGAIDAFKGIRDYGFVIQTFVLAVTNGAFTLYFYLFGYYTLEVPILDHMPKLNDLILSFIYLVTIVLVNSVVRRDVMRTFSCNFKRVRAMNIN